MIEWAWGVSRLIDGLQKTASQNKIDTTHIAVKGCSYAGKMALYVGAFDERVALTIPEESGGGGEASWRFMATQTGTEDLKPPRAPPGTPRISCSSRTPRAGKLPYDEHELVAMVAPRSGSGHREHRHRPTGKPGGLRFDEGRHRGLQGARRFPIGSDSVRPSPRRTAHSRAARRRTCRPSSTSSSSAKRPPTRTSRRARTTPTSQSGSPGRHRRCNSSQLIDAE